jgi:hypothetical protein
MLFSLKDHGICVTADVFQRSGAEIADDFAGAAMSEMLDLLFSP